MDDEAIHGQEGTDLSPPATWRREEMHGHTNYWVIHRLLLGADVERLSHSLPCNLDMSTQASFVGI